MFSVVCTTTYTSGKVNVREIGQYANLHGARTAAGSHRAAMALPIKYGVTFDYSILEG